MPRSHKNLNRLYIDAPMGGGSNIVLDKSQSNYLLNVLRKRAGDEIVVFNGRDGAWLAKIALAGKKTAELVLEQQTAPQTPASDLWYGFAPLKSARLDYVVQKATEMGVGTIQPVLTQHTQVTRIKHDRLTANAIEAAEQCEVLSIPTVAPEVTLARLLDSWPQMHGDRKLILADEGENAASPIDLLRNLDGEKLGLLIGPEGGFSDEERDLLRKKPFVVPVSLGPRILRADTAAVAALALIQAIIGDWR